jgi:hypothetical protein
MRRLIYDITLEARTKKTRGSFSKTANRNKKASAKNQKKGKTIGRLPLAPEHLLGN